MKKKPIKNMAASIRQRLLNEAKAAKKPFQEVLQYYAMERFLHRLSQSKHADKFVLKGALMFVAWGAKTSRPTKDIDLLGRTKNELESIVSIVRDICAQQVDDDGLKFDHENVTGIIIKEDAEYEGVRTTFLATLGAARVSMQIDIGFGDVIHPKPLQTTYPTILDHEQPQLSGYSRESAIAEKFEAMVSLGMFNTRLKDFYDVWLLSRTYEFDGRDLAIAIQKTFANRQTDVVASPVALTETFSNDETKKKQWAAFLRKSRLSDAPSELSVVTEEISRFLSPVAQAIVDSDAFGRGWTPSGPWS